MRTDTMRCCPVLGIDFQPSTPRIELTAPAGRRPAAPAATQGSRGVPSPRPAGTAAASTAGSPSRQQLLGSCPTAAACTWALAGSRRAEWGCSGSSRVWPWRCARMGACLTCRPCKVGPGGLLTGMAGCRMTSSPWGLLTGMAGCCMTSSCPAVRATDCRQPTPNSHLHGRSAMQSCGLVRCFRCVRRVGGCTRAPGARAASGQAPGTRTRGCARAGLLRGEMMAQALPCIVAAHELAPQAGSRVLDMCSGETAPQQHARRAAGSREAHTLCLICMPRLLHCSPLSGTQQGCKSVPLRGTRAAHAPGCCCSARGQDHHAGAAHGRPGDCGGTGPHTEQGAAGVLC